ncbi:hypothetical protein GCM10022209_21490 [Chitinophaga oryziterrae]
MRSIVTVYSTCASVSDFTVSTNPATYIVTITSGAESNAIARNKNKATSRVLIYNVKVTNANGKLMKSMNFSDLELITFYVQDLMPGIYFLDIFDGEKTREPKITNTTLTNVLLHIYLLPGPWSVYE